MKRWLIILAALLPLSGMANMLTPSNNTNDLNNPNRPGYTNPSQQRMQNEMQVQQQQQKLRLQQQQQQEQQQLQRKMQEHRDSARQRIIDSQPGHKQN